MNATAAGRDAGVLVVGPLPPPYHGGAVATQYVLRSSLSSEFRLVHADTTDHRGLENIGRLDAMNVVLALRHFARFVGLLAKERCGVVHVPIAQNRLGYLRDMLFLVPALATGRRVVVHVHAGGFRDFHDGTDSVTRALVRFTMARVHRAIVLGERLRGTVHGLVDDARVCVVPNGIDDPFAAGIDKRAANDGPCTVLYLGTLMEAKGFLDILSAARLLADAGSPIRFVFAGDFFRPSDREQAERLSAGMPPALIEFTGAVDEEARAALLCRADIFVFPTRYANEAHPYVVLEAMAAALPVIATAWAAIPETVREDETGLLVPPSDAVALARAILRLASDAALRRRLGDVGRRRFLEEYTIERWSERMAEVYREALAGA